MTESALEFRGIGKQFFGIPVLKEIGFTVAPGRILGLVGENGAGKSTLMNILGGNLVPDTGSMRLKGKEYQPRSPMEATAIGFVHQELNLFPNLSIADNLHIRSFPRLASWLPLVDRSRINDRTRERLQELGLDLAPQTLVSQLSSGEKQLVEIAKALHHDVDILILDEPTTSLTQTETQRLFSVMEQLRSQGIAIIYISHNLEHILEQTDDIVVLRDGELVTQGKSQDFDQDSLVTHMVGHTIQQHFPKRNSPPHSNQIVFEAKDLSAPGIVENISFDLQAGEILGIAGLMGSGRTELARLIFGLDDHTTGSLHLAGHEITHCSTAERIQLGMAFLTEDRRLEGLCLDASIEDNLSLTQLRDHSHSKLGWIDHRSLNESNQAAETQVTLPSKTNRKNAVKTLSGGNQQKVVLAKWLARAPRLLILDEPTRGIDVAAKEEIYQSINVLSRKDTGVLIISSEIEELIGLCDRILVMNRGRIDKSFNRADFDQKKILASALHRNTPKPVSA